MKQQKRKVGGARTREAERDNKEGSGTTREPGQLLCQVAQLENDSQLKFVLLVKALSGGFERSSEASADVSIRQHTTGDVC